MKRKRTKSSDFDAMVERAISELPERYRQAMKNLSIVVDEWPDPELLEDDASGEDLLGLYVGVPLPQRQFGETLMPDQIFLFRGPLERMCRSREELQEQIRVTLIHELGHYFGFEEEDLHERGWE